MSILDENLPDKVNTDLEVTFLKGRVSELERIVQDLSTEVDIFKNRFQILEGKYEGIENQLRYLLSKTFT